MTQTDIHTIPDRRLRERLDRFFAGLGQGFNAYLERRSRVGEINRLNAMSDAELKAMGISRERIPHYVFRDLMHI
jgi:uncharacterized protein YjiS (DUF1127 family)